MFENIYNKYQINENLSKRNSMLNLKRICHKNLRKDGSIL